MSSSRIFTVSRLNFLGPALLSFSLSFCYTNPQRTGQAGQREKLLDDHGPLRPLYPKSGDYTMTSLDLW